MRQLGICNGETYGASVSKADTSKRRRKGTKAAENNGTQTCLRLLRERRVENHCHDVVALRLRTENNTTEKRGETENKGEAERAWTECDTSWLEHHARSRAKTQHTNTTKPRNRRKTRARARKLRTTARSNRTCFFVPCPPCFCARTRDSWPERSWPAQRNIEVATVRNQKRARTIHATRTGSTMRKPDVERGRNNSRATGAYNCTEPQVRQWAKADKTPGSKGSKWTAHQTTHGSRSNANEP